MLKNAVFVIKLTIINVLLTNICVATEGKLFNKAQNSAKETIVLKNTRQQQMSDEQKQYTSKATLAMQKIFNAMLGDLKKTGKLREPEVIIDQNNYKDYCWLTDDNGMQPASGDNIFRLDSGELVNANAILRSKSFNVNQIKKNTEIDDDIISDYIESEFLAPGKYYHVNNRQYTYEPHYFIESSNRKKITPLKIRESRHLLEDLHFFNNGEDYINFLKDKLHQGEQNYLKQNHPIEYYLHFKYYSKTKNNIWIGITAHDYYPYNELKSEISRLEKLNKEFKYNLKDSLQSYYINFINSFKEYLEELKQKIENINTNDNVETLDKSTYINLMKDIDNLKQIINHYADNNINTNYNLVDNIVKILEESDPFIANITSQIYESRNNKGLKDLDEIKNILIQKRWNIEQRLVNIGNSNDKYRLRRNLAIINISLNMTKSQVAMIKAYTRSEYLTINAILKGYNSMYGNRSFSTNLFITMLLTYDLNNMDTMESTVFRGDNISPGKPRPTYDDEISNSIHNNEPKHTSKLTSTSYDDVLPHFARDNGYITKIHNARGIPLSIYTSVEGEREILLPPDQAFTIDSVSYNGGFQDYQYSNISIVEGSFLPGYIKDTYSHRADDLATLWISKKPISTEQPNPFDKDTIAYIFRLNNGDKIKKTITTKLNYLNKDKTKTIILTNSYEKELSRQHFTFSQDLHFNNGFIEQPVQYNYIDKLMFKKSWSNQD